MDEIDHFAHEFLGEVDMADTAYAYIPMVWENMRTVVQNLLGGAIPISRGQQYINEMLDRMNTNPILKKNCLATIVSVLDQTRSSHFITYAGRYQSEFILESGEINYIDSRIGFYQQQLQAEKQFAVGAVPPEIDLPTPDGGSLKLTDLRGKVVLLDFWASWCRPCRQENPNVVKAYNKYKEKGFDILSVSLDRDRASWLRAIEQDKMTWNHVSDLKFWQSKAAKTYRVSSIPATFLLDRDGKILAKNLRGPMLERKLAEVLTN